MRRLFIVVSALLAATPALADQGVSDDEVVIGSVGDLSGIFASFGAPAVAGARLHFDEVNAAGGIHGRTIRFVVEDSSYQMPKAIQGFNKLINRDRVFAMLLNLGTPMNVAGFKLMTPKNIPNISPLSAGYQMLAPPVRLKFAASTSNYDQMRLAARYMIEQGHASKLCAMYIPSDFGKEVREAIADEAQAHEGASFVTETTHKPDEADFVGSLQKLQGEGCEMVAVALGIRQTITTMGTAKKLGLTGIRFIGPSGAFHSALAKVPGGVTEGLHAVSGWSDLAARAGDPAVSGFIGAWQEAHGEFPNTGALLGYSAATGFTRALEIAGRELTVDSLIRAIESLDYFDPIMNVQVTYGPDDHRGVDVTILSVIRDGNWQEITRLQ